MRINLKPCTSNYSVSSSTFLRLKLLPYFVNHLSIRKSYESYDMSHTWFMCHMVCPANKISVLFDVMRCDRSDIAG